MKGFNTTHILLIITVIGAIFYFLIYRTKSRKLFKNKIESVLSNYEYYYKLNPKQKERFTKIIMRFNSNINYYGRDGLVITDEMRIIIGAGFAKLNMGRDFYKLYFFKTIVIFPHAYRAKEQKVKYLGKTSMDGYISLSWEDILKGEANLHDGVNLVIHELAHAIVVELMQAQHDLTFEYAVVTEIYLFGKKEIEAVKNGKEPVFKDYAYSSPHEFFAIAVEVFFELPEKLIENYWGTYRNLCILFSQNPLKNEIENISWESIINYPHEPEKFYHSRLAEIYLQNNFY